MGPTRVPAASVYFIEMITFGINSNDLKKTAPILAAALDIPFRPHESCFRGGDYYRAETVHGTVSLQNNCDADAASEVPFEDDWPRDRLILYCDGLNDEAWRPFVKRVLALTELQPAILSKKAG